MPKPKSYLNRLDEIFLQPDGLHPEPAPEDSPESPPEADGWLLSVETSPVEAPTPPQESQLVEATLPQVPEKLGWEEFLDAITRSEQIGYQFEKEQETHVPLLDGVEGEASPQAPNILEVPLALGETNFGALHLEAEPDHPWTPEEAAMAENIARQIAQHLENLRLVEQSQRYRQEAEMALRRQVRQGWETRLEQAEVLPAGFSYDQTRVEPLQEVATVSPPPEREALVEPLKVRDEVIGQLVVEEPASQTAELVAAVADRLSVHIEGLRLLEATETARQQLDKRAAELQTVARVSTAAATILDPGTLLQSVVELTTASFNLYHAHIFLVEQNSNQLALKASAGKRAAALLRSGYAISLDDEASPAATTARRREGLFLNNLELDGGATRHPLLLDTRSELCVPMIVGEQLLGVFDAHSDQPERFSEDDLRTYATLASSVAVALRNAELYAEQMATVERLKELDHLKSSFLANMSHELRTPLNSILGFTQVLIEGLDGPLTESMNNDLELIAKNSQHLLNLINDILDMAKIEAGRVTLSMEPLNLRDLLEDVLETTASLARERSLFQNLDIGEREAYEIYGDGMRLRQILLNLIGNAIKFTESGGITVQVERSEAEVLVRIHDTGIGIPPDKLGTIFEAFSQVDTSTTRKVGGTGLGLPISRRLVEMHGGRLWAESSGFPGEGSTFYLVLPVQQQEADKNEEKE